MSTQREPIGVIGTGYVGLVTAAGFAELGSDVYCIDIDADKIARLERGEIPIYEPGLQEMVARNRERLHFSTDITTALEAARLLFVAVGTPPTYSGDADLSAVNAVVAAMPPSDRHALVMKSTVPVGTGRNIKRVFAEQGKEGFRYVSCPEFLKEGSAVDDFLRPDRVVVGDDADWAGDAVVDLYRPLLSAAHGGAQEGELVRTDIASAEMVKLASNAFLATKISFINEIANVCEETGADVIEVAKGMGLDKRIGPKFLQAGVGFGGSCLAGDETVMAREHGTIKLRRLDHLWSTLAQESVHAQTASAEGVEVLAWRDGRGAPEYLPLMGVSRRPFAGQALQVRTNMGRRVTCTPDHPFVVRDAAGETRVKLARDLTTEDRLPIPLGRGVGTTTGREQQLYTLAALDLAGIGEPDVIVRPAAGALAGIFAEQARVLDHPRGAAVRAADIRRTGTVRLDEARELRIPVHAARAGTVKNGTQLPSTITGNAAFWRVVGLYLAEGHLGVDGRRHRLQWSFHPTREEHLIDEVAGFWRALGVKADVRRGGTAAAVVVSSRILASWWRFTLGLGRNCYEQRLPDLIWEQDDACVDALLSGVWEGDGSWSLLNGGPSVMLEYGTASAELADGVLRLLAARGIVASQRIGRTAKSTVDTHWLRVSGAQQIRDALFLVPDRDRPGVLASIARQSKEISSTGFRRGESTAWVRVVDVSPVAFDGDVYAVEVPGAHTFATTGGLVSHNCFPKDVNALKQLAGNSGYHFQLLNAVIEVNELQKRRVMGKLEKHLGSLIGKRIALLGLAFKPNTDDMREATSLVLCARLQAAGAHISAFDPIAEEEARKLIQGVRFADSALDAVTGADAVVLVTEWSEFAALDWTTVAAAMDGNVLVDGRNALDPAVVTQAGLVYEGIGRGAAG